MHRLIVAFVVLALLPLLPRPARSDDLHNCLGGAFRATSCVGVVQRKCRQEHAGSDVDCLKQEADAWDGLLNRLWTPLKTQSEKHGDGAANRLLLSQRAWIRFRDAECSGNAALGANKNDSIRGQEACRLSLTVRRVLDFRAWLRLPAAPPDAGRKAATEALLHCLRYSYNPAECHDFFFPEPNDLGGYLERVRLAEAKRAAWDAVLATVVADLLENAATLEERHLEASLELLARHADPDPVTRLYAVGLHDTLEADHARWLEARETRCAALRATWIDRRGVEATETIGASVREKQPQCVANITSIRVLEIIDVNDYIISLISRVNK